MKIRTYEEAREYLESFINPSIYKRIAKHEEVQDPLVRMRLFLELLGNPQDEFQSIVVTGTSGKGSTSYFLAEILSYAGYHTGLTISPHLQALNERIQTDLVPISDEDFIAILNKIIPVIVTMQGAYNPPTYYEILLAMTFLYFLESGIDIAVVEVGLEGKYDGTNVLSPILTVLTNISLDHTELLGNSVEEIAAEAVSAIKQSNNAVVTGRLQDSVRDIVKNCMRENGVDALYELEIDYRIKNVKGESHATWFTFEEDGIRLDHVEINFGGLYQAENAGVALAAALTLESVGITLLVPEIIDALKFAEEIPGRYEQFIYRSQEILLDGAHNPAKMQALISSLSVLEPKRKKVFVIAFKKDKDISEMLEQILPVADAIICTTFHATSDMTKNASTDIQSLRAHIPQTDTVSFEEDSRITLEKAVEMTRGSDSIIVVTGSLYLVGEMRTIIEEEIDVSVRQQSPSKV